MHLTLKNEATRPASENFLQQQVRFDDFIDYFNDDRPHQALNMQVPADRYEKSPRPYKGLGDLDYPFHDWTPVGSVVLNPEQAPSSSVDKTTRQLS